MEREPETLGRHHNRFGPDWGLSLLRGPEVRSEVLAYRGQFQSDMHWYDYYSETHFQALMHLGQRIEIKLGPNIAPGESRAVRGHLAVHDDPESLADMTNLHDLYFDRVWALEQVQRATEALLKVLGP